MNTAPLRIGGLGQIIEMNFEIGFREIDIYCRYLGRWIYIVDI